MSCLIFGCGYLGARVGKLWKSEGRHVVSVTHSDDQERINDLALQGFFTAGGDVTKPETLEYLWKRPKTFPFDAVDTVLFAVGYDRSTDTSIEEVYGEGMRNVLTALPESAQRLIYISTTGVYGSAEGEWIDEQTPPDPQRAGGRASLLAEQAIAEHPLGKSAAALRLAGIYGPGRIPYLDKLRAGEAISAPSEGWLNLIHVDDAAQIVVELDRWLDRKAGSESLERPGLFNGSDGAPVVRGEYYQEVARRIGAPPPQFAAPDSNSPATRRAAANKRVSNRKLVETLGYSFQYPTYREGLAAILP